MAKVRATILVLALLSDRTTIALAAEDRGETGDALAVEAAESRLAIASGAAFAFRRAATLVAFLVLAQSAGRATVALATEHFESFGDASTLAAGESRLTVAG
jgi:hypothetical protein